MNTTWKASTRTRYAFSSSWSDVAAAHQPESLDENRQVVNVLLKIATAVIQISIPQIGTFVSNFKDGPFYMHFYFYNY